jgi:phosphatidylglycerol:prolipoprotein diacylglycerol transferase
MTAYNTFALLACFTGVMLFARECRRAEMSIAHAIALPLLALLVTRFGAGMLYAFETWQWESHWTNFFSFTRGGLSLYGGLYVGVFLAWIYAQAWDIPPLYFFDLAAAPLAFTLAVGRLGCFFAGCCRGPELPEGWILPASIPQPHLFPTPLVGSIVNLLIGIALYRIPFDKGRPGRRAGWFFILYGLARMGLEYLRTNAEIWAGLTMVQILSIPLILGGIAIFWWSSRLTEPVHRPKMV